MAYKRKEDQAAAAARHYKKNAAKIKARSKRRNINQRKKTKPLLIGLSQFFVVLIAVRIIQSYWILIT